ncbi:MAG: hypothetical protein C0594_09855 [Marinilabiliales bacterium]|nr:MAG: hypothetical protein C0594_09855 [Marinilabiliales bacterium]
MNCIDYISALNNVKEKHHELWAVIEMFILAFREDFLLSENIHFYKSDIANYYGVDKETLWNWKEVFDKEDSLEEIFKQKFKTPIKFSDFIKIVDVFGYSDIQFYFPNDKVEKNVNYIIPDKLDEYDEAAELNSVINNVIKLRKERRIKYVEYRPYSKKELLEILDDGSGYKNLSNDLETFFKVNLKMLNIIPPKQSCQFIKHILDISDLKGSMALFNIPKISEPGIRKSQMSLEKRMKKFLKDNQFVKSDYEYRKLLNSNESKGSS